MTDTPCPRCTADTTDGLLCWTCLHLFRDTITRLRRVLPELDTTVAGLDQITPTRQTDRPAAPAPAVHGPGEYQVAARLRSSSATSALAPKALPINVQAADQARRVRTLIRDTIEQFAADSGLTIPPGVGLVAWIAGREHEVRQHPLPAWLLGQLHKAARIAEAIVDRRPPERYVGPCTAEAIHLEADGDEVTLIPDRQCGNDMYTRPGAQTATCSRCQTVHPLTGRQDWLLDEVRQVHARPHYIAQALTSMHRPLNTARLEQWIARDRKRAHRAPCALPGGGVCIEKMAGCGHPPILTVGVDESGAPVYRVGDILARLDWVNPPELRDH